MTIQHDGYTEETVAPPKSGRRHVGLKDFRAYMPAHSYLYIPTREMWPATSVNARIPPIELRDKNGNPKVDKNGNVCTIPAALWLDRNQPVEQVAWCPGKPMLLPDQLVSEGGFLDHPGVTLFNLYRPPNIKLGKSAEATPWIELVHKVFGDDAEHLIQWFAHRVQLPQEKINHAIVLGGEQGIGKDTILEPVKRAVGPWNFQEVSPGHLLGRFNGFARSTILRVSEARDLGEVNRFAFYDHCKIYTAAPPDVLRVDEKHLREYYVFNCLGFIITTNHKTDGLYLPSDDRRHFVAWSPRQIGDTTSAEWDKLWRWYRRGGFGHVTAYLTELDLTDFDPKAPPPKTAAFWDIADTGRAPEDAELADVIDTLNKPDVVTPRLLTAAATGEASEWLCDRRNRRAIPHRLERCGYVPVRNPDAKDDGYWVVDKKRQRIYARVSLTPTERLEAARELVKRG